MIEFKQLSEGTPPDIEAVSDDSNAELVRMTDAFENAGMEDCESALNLAQATMGEDDKLTFIIPGDEAADVADVFAMGGLDELDDFIADVQRKALERAEGVAKSQKDDPQ